MTKPITVEECKRMLFKLGLKHGVSPSLISSRLLCKEDKNDMLQGLVSFDTLDCAVAVWKEYGMCNYADGSGKPYEHFRAYIAKSDPKGRAD